MAKREKILLVTIRDKEGYERLMPYHIEGAIRAGLAELRGMLDPGNKVVRYQELGSNYFIEQIVALGHLGDGDARASALGELEEFLYMIAPAIRELNNK